MDATSSNAADIMSPAATAVPATAPLSGSEPKQALWKRYFNIVWELALVDFRKKYHNSTLGYFWSMLNPLLRFLVFHFVFTYLFISIAPKFTLYLLTGVFFFNFFQDATLGAISAIGRQARLTKRIFFPRYLIVFSSCTTALLSYIINLSLIVLVVLVFDHVSPLQFLTIIPFILIVLFSTGLAMMLAILYVHFRDISEIWNVILMLGFWLTPIMYDPQNVPGPLATISLLNPVGRILVMLRAYLVFDNLPSAPFVIVTAGVSVGTFLFGWWIFKKYEHRVPEYL